MNGISKEAYLQGTPEQKDEIMFDLVYGLHGKIEEHADKCPIKKSVGRLWTYSLAVPGMVVTIVVIIKFFA